MNVLFIGLTGSPPTISGHEAMIRAAIDKYLDSNLKVVIVPSADGSPVLGKAPSAPAVHRLAMTKIMAEKIRQDYSDVTIEVSSLEIVCAEKTQEPSRLYNTLSWLYGEKPLPSGVPEELIFFDHETDRLILVYGQDSIANMPKWFNSGKLLLLMQQNNIGLCYMPRGDVQLSGDNLFLRCAHLLQGEDQQHNPDASSTRVRRALLADSPSHQTAKDILQDVHPEILDYIQANKLYQSDSGK